MIFFSESCIYENIDLDESTTLTNMSTANAYLCQQQCQENEGKFTLFHFLIICFFLTPPCFKVTQVWVNWGIVIGLAQ